MQRWSPAPLGQAVAPPPTPMDAFLGSPGVSLATDLTAAAVATALAVTLNKAKSSWSTFWIVVAAASGVKAFHDVSHL